MHRYLWMVCRIHRACIAKYEREFWRWGQRKHTIFVCEENIVYFSSFAMRYDTMWYDTIWRVGTRYVFTHIIHQLIARLVSLYLFLFRFIFLSSFQQNPILSAEYYSVWGLSLFLSVCVCVRACVSCFQPSQISNGNDNNNENKCRT